MSNTITVYSKPQCVQCDMTVRELDNRNIDYNLVDLTTEPQALNYVKELGYQSAPVVVAGTQHWSGFRPDKLKSL